MSKIDESKADKGKRSVSRVGNKPLLVTTALVKGCGWKSTKDLLRDVFAATQLFKLGKIDDVSARVYLGQFRNAAKIISLNLEHARLTNRLKSGDTTLTGFTLE